MALQKQNLNINFAQGLQTKQDPWQVPPGQFLALQNTIFTTGGMLRKRNGFAQLTSLPDETSILLTTFNGDATAIGTSIYALSSGYAQWVNRGMLEPITLSTLPLIRNNTNQSQVDTAVSVNGLVCTVYTDQNPSNLSANIYKYAVADATTGQNIIEPTLITNADATYGTPRVFFLGNYFVIVYTFKLVSTYHLQYIAISINNPTVITSPVDITTNYAPATTLAWDGVVYSNNLYLAWNGASSSGIEMTYLTGNLSLASSVNRDATHTATLFSVTADSFNGRIWVSYYSSSTSNGYTLVTDPLLASILSPTQIISSETVMNLTSLVVNKVLTFYYEISNNYSYDASIPTHFIKINTLTQSGTLGTATVLIRSVGLASKAFFVNGNPYFLSEYQSPYQCTYFLISGAGNIIAKLGYGNGEGPVAAGVPYLSTGLPSVTVNGNIASMGYLLKDVIEAVNKNTNVPTGSQTAGVFSQTGINLVNFTFPINGIENSFDIITAEIGNNLNITGGFIWSYDGYSSVEQEFFLYPDSIEASWSATGGSIHAQPDGMTNTNAYFYQVTYEWTDNQGNPFRSAPSIPISVTTTGTGTSGSITINIPYLRLTYKTANPVKLVIYRWSIGQQIYYQTTSIEMPILNLTTSDSIAYVDTNSDSTILGNNVLYTTGGVLENIGPPSFSSVFIFDDRLWGITSEDPNLLWFSKQVLETTPVEMSDLLTIYVAPNIGAQGSTGPLKCGFALDDKCILFKASAINYFNGTGPDNTGANSQYSQPIFITSTVGCSNQHSIVFQPQGLMFEFASEAGNQIWLLGRDLSTNYIGAPVEKYTLNATVLSSVNIPGTNQVRFTMSTGITLMYDYYYGQWGSFANIPAISSTLYQGLHTYLNQYGQVFQESPGVYLDGSTPVLMSFTTSWYNLAGLQGYQRAYRFYLLGNYITPHLLTLQIAYDYNSNPTQMSTIYPTNFAAPYGDDLNYGSGSPYGASGSPYGTSNQTGPGQGTLEQWRIHLTKQRCQSFQITLNEIYNPLYGISAGAGLTLSGIDLVFGLKKGYRPIKAEHSIGGA